MHVLRVLRRRVMTPDVSAVRLDVRGFHEKSPAARELLETIGRTFLAGYAVAAQARIPGDAEDNLEGLPAQFRGFAYEGAAMAFAMRDALRPWGGRNLTQFLAGRGQYHIYMAYVGVGWALARLPRVRWPALATPDPLLRWLALDGYGFHQAYFHTERYVNQQFQDPGFRWPIDSWYANRAIDQGIGRALWFVGGTDVSVVADLLDSFPERRRPDLCSGLGLAATYAGGADVGELRKLVDWFAPYRAQLAQGAAFAAGARRRAGLVVAHNELATGVLCGMTVAEAAAITDAALPCDATSGSATAYELWRARTADLVLERRKEPPP